MAKKGTAPQSKAAQGAEPGLDSEWAIYRYPAVAVNKPIAVELSVRRSLIKVSTLSAIPGQRVEPAYNQGDDRLYAFLLD
jgi:hypothetical protein